MKQGIVGSLAYDRRDHLGWVLLTVTAIASIAAFSWRGTPAREGNFVEMQFSFVPSDSVRLSCSGGTPTCGVAGPTRAVPAVTTGGDLYIVEGIFMTDGMAEGVRRHRRTNARFTLTCRGKLLEQLSRVRVRFNVKGPYNEAEDVWLLRVDECG